MLGGIFRFLSAILIVMLVAFAASAKPEDDVIRSDALKDMRKFLNESVDPCKDFYKFTCGNWAKYYTLPRTTYGMDLFHIMKVDYNQNLDIIMERTDNIDTELHLKVKSLYKSCMKIPNNWNSYYKDLKSIIEEFGKMPALVGDEWQEESFDWQQTMAEIYKKYGIPIIIAVVQGNDTKDSTEGAIAIGRGFTPVGPRTFYPSDMFKLNRMEYISSIYQDMSKYLGVTDKVAKETAEEIFQFEQSLAHGYPGHDTYLPTTYDELESSYSPALNITQFLRIVYRTIPPYKISADEIYLKNLITILPNTSKKTLANYIFYKLLKSFFFSDTLFKYQLQDLYCLGEIREMFPYQLENMLYHRYATGQKLNDLEVIWNGLKSTFEDQLESPSNEWIDNNVKSYALEKLNALEFKILGATVSSEDTEVLEMTNINSDDFLQNMKALRAVRANIRNYVFKPSEYSREEHTSPALPPSNIPELNRVVIPIVTLQSQQLLSTSLPMAYNFGRLGTTLGIEITCGFDSTGRFYGKHGERKDWWGKDFAKEYFNRVQCFIDQYSKYEFGDLSEGLNIRNNVGLAMSYLSYLKWYELNKESEEKKIRETFHDFPYTNKQLFFISFSQEWCTETHSVMDVNAALVNMQEFNEVFNCPVGSAMNPVEKCKMF